MADNKRQQRQGNPGQDTGDGSRQADRRYRPMDDEQQRRDLEDAARRAREGGAQAPRRDRDDSDL